MKVRIGTRGSDLALWQAVRVPAWAAAALSLTLLARHGVSRLKSRGEVG